MEPDAVLAACRVKDISNSQNTALGLAGAPKQGRFLELTGRESAVSAVLKLNECEVLEPYSGEKFAGLANPAGQLELFQKVETAPVTL